VSKPLTAYVEAQVTAFKADEAALTAITALLTAYQTAYTKAEAPSRGKVGVLAACWTCGFLHQNQRKNPD
jgi:hypothetical protein